ncbi:hypothetical protein [Bdellovibrio sp. NC01]|uniref:hypothetical protein n=1 Tax=Bdellovibrio sp. NC01 TaxID=2220073 RepID=UPI001157E12C|nr:hypothetical protein [Bdellovibrio sp. NC01]QDK37937.1 hypothetical protein DOE51_10240 [Bdellovibrio sp. NC01]
MDLKKHLLIILALVVMSAGYLASQRLINFKKDANSTVAIITSLENRGGSRSFKIVHYEFEAGGHKIQGTTIESWADYSEGVQVFYTIDEAGQVHHIVQSNWGDWVYFKLSLIASICLVIFQFISYIVNRKRAEPPFKKANSK